MSGFDEDMEEDDSGGEDSMDHGSVYDDGESVEMSFEESGEAAAGAVTINITTIPTAAPHPASAQPGVVIRPVLKGQLRCENGMIVCQGMWAYVDEHHNDPTKVSEFQFSRADALVAGSEFPRDSSGRYHGWFRVPNFEGPVEEKDLQMIFTPSAERPGDYTIAGKGSNRFGSFILNGSLDAQLNLRVVREYVHVAAPSRPRHKKTHQPGDAPPRESTGRVRKTSSLIVFQDDFSGALKGGSLKRKSIDARSCMEILTHMRSLPQAHWFLEPVDPVLYPEYFTLISEPMDFGTILSNLRVNGYATNEAFEAHVRLVFQNALKFNVQRENPVNIAARELQKLFDEMMRSRGLKAARIREKKPGVGGAFGGRTSLSGPSFGSDGSSLLSILATGGEAVPAKPSGGGGGGGGGRSRVKVDPAVREMQQKMKEMEQELSRLRNAAGIRDPEEESRRQPKFAVQTDWDSLALSVGEKKELVERIYALTPECMARVVTIVQEAMSEGDLAALALPASEDDLHYELSLDRVDPYTQQRLLAYVDVRLLFPSSLSLSSSCTPNTH